MAQVMMNVITLEAIELIHQIHLTLRVKLENQLVYAIQEDSLFHMQIQVNLFVKMVKFHLLNTKVQERASGVPTNTYNVNYTDAECGAATSCGWVQLLQHVPTDWENPSCNSYYANATWTITVLTDKCFEAEVCSSESYI